MSARPWFMDLASLHRAFGRRERARPLYQRALTVLEWLSGFAGGDDAWAEPYELDNSEAVASAAGAYVYPLLSSS